jgi:hypothetical protein
MWALYLNVAIGIWLMAAPSVLGYGRPAAANDWIVGPLIAAFACIACWEITRALHWVAMPLGFWLLLAPWFLDYSPTAMLNSLVTGLATVICSCFGGTITQQYGGGWSALWQSEASVRARVSGR